jgi:hypothetical protein
LAIRNADNATTLHCYDQFCARVGLRIIAVPFWWDVIFIVLVLVLVFVLIIVVVFLVFKIVVIVIVRNCLSNHIRAIFYIPERAIAVID